MDYEQLDRIRTFEIGRILDQLPAGKRVLEIGGGTGAQAKLLSEAGANIVSIDLESSNYRDRRVFPVQNYDGIHIPFDNSEFDIVYSSNVLEHVADLGRLSKEIIRVLKPDGICIHVMPTSIWRFWTSVAHPMAGFVRGVALMKKLVLRSDSTRGGTGPPLSPAVEDSLGQTFSITKATQKIWAAIWPPRHGEAGIWIPELWTFSHWWWIRAFRRNNFEVISWVPGGLFYTGNQLFGVRLSIRTRQCLARFLGSACVIYRVVPISEVGSRSTGES